MAAVSQTSLILTLFVGLMTIIENYILREVTHTHTELHVHTCICTSNTDRQICAPGILREVTVSHSLVL